jgi:peptidoglycan hydrolase CwlO-like protein
MKETLLKVLRTLLALLNTEPGQVEEIARLKAELDTARANAAQAQADAQAAQAAEAAAEAETAETKVALDEAKAANVLNDPEVSALLDVVSAALASTPVDPVDPTVPADTASEPVTEPAPEEPTA